MTSSILCTFKQIWCLYWSFFHSVWSNYSGVANLWSKWGIIVLLALILLYFKVCSFLWLRSADWAGLSVALESWRHIWVYVGNRFRIETIVFLIFNEACKLLLGSDCSCTSLFFYCGKRCSNGLDLNFLQNNIVNSLFKLLIFKNFLLHFGILNISKPLSLGHGVDWKFAPVKIVLRDFHICVYVIMIVFAICSEFIKRTSCFFLLSVRFVLQRWRLKFLTNWSLIS